MDVAFLTRSTADLARSIEWEDGNTSPVAGIGITSAAPPVPHRDFGGRRPYGRGAFAHY